MAPASPSLSPGAGHLTSDDDLLAASLFRGQSDPLAAMFRTERERPPLIIWSPHPRDLDSEQLDAFLAYCWGLPSHAGLPKAASFDPAAAPNPGWLMVLEVEGFGRDFRYVYYGEAVAEFASRRMQGRRSSEIAGHLGRYFAALYRAAMQRRQIVLAEHEPPRRFFVRLWRRLIVPLVDDQGYVVRFAVLNLAENHLRTGLDAVPLPCLVADVSGSIRFANTAARRLVPAPARWQEGSTLEAYFGTPLPLPEDPVAMVDAEPQRLDILAAPDLPGKGAAPLRVVVGAIRFRDVPLLVLTLPLTG